MGKIIVYEHANFQGKSREFTSDVSSLIAENFNNCISSLKVIGEPWVAHENVNFDGSQYVYEEGEYATVEGDDTYSSLEKITEDLTNPQITLYEHFDYGGQSLVLTTETNLSYGIFNDMVSAHKVQRGAWVMYDFSYRAGAQMVARASKNVPRYSWFNDRLSHIRPLKPGKCTV